MGFLWVVYGLIMGFLDSAVSELYFSFGSEEKQVETLMFDHREPGQPFR